MNAPEPRRLPEVTAAARHLALKLHARTSSLRSAAAPPGLRAQLEGSKLSPKVRDALIAAVARAENDEALIAMAIGEPFDELHHAVQRAMLRHAGVVPAPTLALLAESLGRLEVNVQLAAVEAAARTSHPVLLELVELDALRELDVPEQLDLMRFAAGPSLAGPVPLARRAAVDRSWDLLRDVLSSLACSVAGGGTLDALAGFVYRPAVEAHLLRAVELMDHSVVALGDIEAPVMSYGQVWREAPKGYLRASIESPDRSATSGWRHPEIGLEVTYSWRQVRLTPMQALVLVEWLEANYRINSDASAPALGRSLVALNAHAFHTEAYNTIVNITGQRTGLTPRSMRGGRLADDQPAIDPTDPASQLLQLFSA